MACESLGTRYQGHAVQGLWVSDLNPRALALWTCSIEEGAVAATEQSRRKAVTQGYGATASTHRYARRAASESTLSRGWRLFVGPFTDCRSATYAVHVQAVPAPRADARPRPARLDCRARRLRAPAPDFRPRPGPAPRRGTQCPHPRPVPGSPVPPVRPPNPRRKL